MPQTFTVLPYKGQFVQFEEIESGYLYYLNKRINLLSGETEETGISALVDVWKKTQLDQFSDNLHRVLHLFYESSYLFNQLDELLNPLEPLAICLCYRKRTLKPTLAAEGFKKDWQLIPEKIPIFSRYRKSFRTGYEALKRGDCYQFNLTQSYQYQVRKAPREPLKWLQSFWSEEEDRGAFAHATYLASLDMVLLSNSPECLFQGIKKDDSFKIISCPIKGTIRIDPKNTEKSFRALKESQKNLGELNMITDLIRNDLSRIDRPVARVEKTQAFLKVPGLYHQYSKISTVIKKQTTLYALLSALFPGGSITGAPKKRVMELLREIEDGPRGFYCGSTLIASGKMLAASINIRSGYYWPKTGKLRLFAGGGITLKSRESAEFDEMNAKCESILQLMKTQNGASSRSERRKTT